MWTVMGRKRGRVVGGGRATGGKRGRDMVRKGGGCWVGEGRVKGGKTGRVMVRKVGGFGWEKGEGYAWKKGDS